MNVGTMYNDTSGIIASSSEQVQLPQNKNDEGAPRPPQGDTVNISDEARAVLAAKMDEFDAETPHDLTKEERDDIKQTLENTEGVTEEDLEKLAQAGQRGESMGPPPGQGGQSGKPQGGGKPGGGAQSSGGESESSDTIEDLEEEIAELEEEIQELQTKAAKDEDAEKELKAKRVELTLLQDQLTQEENAEG